jgi:hypothetical protein
MDEERLIEMIKNTKDITEAAETAIAVILGFLGRPRSAVGPDPGRPLEQDETI